MAQTQSARQLTAPLTKISAPVKQDVRSVQQIKEDVELRIKAHVYQKRMQIEDFFRDFDVLNTSKITPPQFKRALLRINLVDGISETEQETLVQAYAVTILGATLVNWRNFSDSINEVYTYHISHRSPHKHPEDALKTLRTFQESTLTAMRSSKLPTVTPEDQALLDEVIEKFRFQAQKEGVFVKPLLKDYDKLNRGVVTKTQFRRTISLLGWNISDKVMELLLWKYTAINDPDYIHYAQFVLDVDPPSDDIRPSDLSVKSVAPTKANLDAWQNKDAAEKRLALEKLLKRLQAEEVRRRMMLLDVFHDFDKLRSGVITTQRFRSTLDSMCQFHLSDEDVAALHEGYHSSSDPNMIKYHRFCHDMQAVFTPKEDLLSNPSADVSSLRPSLEDELDLSQISPSELQEIDAIINRLRYVVKTQGINSRPFFQAFDKCNWGLISKTQFMAALDNVGLKMSEKEVTLLINRFRKEDLVRYAAFVHAIEQEST